MSFQPLWEIAEVAAGAGGVLPFPERIEDDPTELTPPPDEPPVDVEALVQEAREQALTEGLAQGMEQGVESTREELESARARVVELEALLQGLELVGEEARASLAQQAVEICVALSRRVLGDTLIHHPAALSKLVLQTLRRFPGGSEIIVRVPPGRAQGVVDAVGEQSVRVEADESLKGGCVVERGGCVVDASLEGLMEGLDQALEEAGS